MQKFIILCIICISNFTARVMTRPVSSVRLAAVLDRSAGQQNSGLFILSHGRNPYGVRDSASLRVVKFDTIGGPVMACMNGTGRSLRRWSTQLSARSCAKVTATRNRAAGREFDGISEANNTTSVFLDVRKIDWRRYRGQKCRNMGKPLHFPSWNVSWLNS